MVGFKVFETSTHLGLEVLREGGGEGRGGSVRGGEGDGGEDTNTWMPIYSSLSENVTLGHLCILRLAGCWEFLPYFQPCTRCV